MSDALQIPLTSLIVDSLLATHYPDLIRKGDSLGVKRRGEFIILLPNVNTYNNVEDFREAIDLALAGYVKQVREDLHAAEALCDAYSQNLFEKAADQHPGEWVLGINSHFVGHSSDQHGALRLAEKIENKTGHQPYIISPGTKKQPTGRPFRR